MPNADVKSTVSLLPLIVITFPEILNVWLSADKSTVLPLLIVNWLEPAFHVRF